MKITDKTIPLLFVVVLMVSSCSNFSSLSTVNPTDVMETAKSLIETAIIETQTAIPAASSTPILPTPIPPTSLPPTDTPVPINTSIPISGTPTVIATENGLIWTECIVPYFNHPRETADFKFAASCLNMDWPSWDSHDIELNGQRLREERVNGDGNHGDNLRLIIGEDIYETDYTYSNGRSDYDLLKNGEIIAKASAYPYRQMGDPNLKLWNIGGKSVWEIFSEPPAIIVDGTNLNEIHQWEGSFFPYDIKNKLIYIAKKDGKYIIVYDEKVIGSEFDEIYMSYCCASTTVLYGHEQYWFWGRREGTYYAVAIH